MKFPIYCIRDIHTGFGTPVLNTNDFTAVRDFKYRMNSEGIMEKNAKDFDLYKIGEFNSEDASIVSGIPVLICSGTEAVD